MKLKYVYGIIIVIFILLIIIYKLMNKTPAPTAAVLPPPSKKPITHNAKLTTVYTPGSSGYPLSASLDINIIDSTTSTYTVHPSSSSVITGPTFWGDFMQYPNSQLSIGGIQYSGSYLNFYQNLSGSPPTRMALQDPTTYGLTISDTSGNSLIYDTSTASISGQTLTFYADTGTLTIVFT